MIIMPGFCTSGTVGAKVIAGEKQVEIDGDKVSSYRNPWFSY